MDQEISSKQSVEEMETEAESGGKMRKIQMSGGRYRATEKREFLTLMGILCGLPSLICMYQIGN